MVSEENPKDDSLLTITNDFSNYSNCGFLRREVKHLINEMLNEQNSVFPTSHFQPAFFPYTFI